MNDNPKSTALVLFARTVESEVIEKSLLPSSKKNSLLHNQLLKSSQSIVKRGNGAFLHFHEGMQEGLTFGERLANCVEKVFSQGYEKIILLGSDCPDLSIQDIDKASSELVAGKFVLGPDQNGGTYLIGFIKEHFDYQLFANLQWNTENLFQELKAYASDFTKTSELPLKIDLNSVEDVLKHTTSSIKLRTILTDIFKELFKCSYLSNQQYPGSNLSRIHRRRGPPVYA